MKLKSRKEINKQANLIAVQYLAESEAIKKHTKHKTELSTAAKSLGEQYGEDAGSSKLVITDRFEVGVCEAKSLQFNETKFAADHPEIFKQCSTIVVVLDKEKLKKLVEQKKISASVVQKYISYKTQQRVVVRKKGTKDDSQEEGNLSLW